MVRASAFHSLLGSRPAGGCYGEPKRGSSCQPDSPLGYQDFEQGQSPCNVAHADLKAVASCRQRCCWNLTRRRAHKQPSGAMCYMVHSISQPYLDTPGSTHRQLFREAALPPSIPHGCWPFAIREGGIGPSASFGQVRCSRTDRLASGSLLGVISSILEIRHPSPWQQRRQAGKDNATVCVQSASTRATKLCPAFPRNESHATGVGERTQHFVMFSWC